MTTAKSMFGRIYNKSKCFSRINSMREEGLGADGEPPAPCSRELSGHT